MLGRPDAALLMPYFPRYAFLKIPDISHFRSHASFNAAVQSFHLSARSSLMETFLGLATPVLNFCSRAGLPI